MRSPNPAPTRPSTSRWTRVLAAFLAAAASSTARAGVVDPAGDILATYVNQASAPGDLDVVFAHFLYDRDADTFTFTSTQAAAIGSTPGSLYVWGVDRGTGTARFVAGTPSVGAGVLFDSVVVLRPDTSVTVSDIINLKTTNLGLGVARIDGNTISATISASLLPELGLFARTAYTTNLWPRVGAGNNNQITDFAPDASNFVVTVVPEPSTVALSACAAIVLPVALARRRRR